MDAVEIDTTEEVQNDDGIDTTVPEVCRVCLHGNLLMRDLFVENEVVSLSTKAMSFASVKMLPEDGLPGQVCCDCADKLDSAYEFKLQVEQADNVLRQRYDSLNIKEELFFNEVEVHLEGERADVEDEDSQVMETDESYQTNVDSLSGEVVDDEKSTLLKDHLALLQVQKLAEEECAASLNEKHSNEIAEESTVAEMLESTSDHSQYLDVNDDNGDEIATCEIYGQSVKEETMHVIEGMAIDEHNYIMQQGYGLARTEEELESQETVDSTANETSEYLSMMNDEINSKNTSEQSENSIKIEQSINHENVKSDATTPNETRRSKRQSSKRMRNTDQDNYFENLNLSSRLKKNHEKLEKIFFLCYLCDKQFVSKNILKEHMHSHEEVRRTLSLKKTEKFDKRSSPTKISSTRTTSATSTPTSSGKKSNKCPYCGKEYLYVISFNKHLKQHEKNKDSSRDEGSMTFEESLRANDDEDDEDEDDESNFVTHEDDNDDPTSENPNERVKRENDDRENDEQITKKRNSNRSTITQNFTCEICEKNFDAKSALNDHHCEHVKIFKCNTCDREFDELEKLRRHRSDHVVDGVLSSQDLDDHIYQREFDVVGPHDDETSINYETIDDEQSQINLQTINDEQNISQRENDNDDSANDNDNEWTLEIQPNDDENYEATDCKEKIEEIDENWSESKDLKCPNCPAVYTHEKSLSRHMETHIDANYVCKICKKKFSRKERLQRHVEQQHEREICAYKCDDCEKTFGNELTMRNHLIATNHKTRVHGVNYDPNKRLKRVAAKAAQKIIDKIKTEDIMDDDGTSGETIDGKNSKIDARWSAENSKTHQTSASRKSHQRNGRRCDFECETCGRKCSSKQSLTKHVQQHGIKNENFDDFAKIDGGKKSVSFDLGDGSTLATQQKKSSSRDEATIKRENPEDDDNSDFESGLDWPMDSHKCPTCKKKYSTKKSLLRHQLLHEEPHFECDICNVKFYRKDKLKSHYDKCSEKNPDQVRKCNICGDSFENNEMLKEHRGKHVDEGILTEDDLRDIEPDERREGGKIVRKRRTDIVGLECTECNKRYTSRKGLLRHIQVHEGKKYLCDICPKKFYRREHLKIHVAKHNMIKPYKCSRCTKRFIKEEQLANHLSKHDRNFKKTKETDSSKRFLCEICSKSFTQSTTLIAHLRAHNGIKPYVCEVCARPFTTNAYLKMHMRTHTQERPYSCQYCSRAFARADTLANHLTSHTGEAKYHCKYCPKNFRRLKSLKEHVFIHTGQRPYSCPTCDRRFNNNGSRYAHSKRCKQNILQNQNREQSSSQNLVQGSPQHIRIHQLAGDQTGQMQLVKSQNIKTITIARPSEQISGHQVLQHQELLMPLILPLTVTLTDVDEEVILPEGTKIFTTA